MLPNFNSQTLLFFALWSILLLAPFAWLLLLKSHPFPFLPQWQPTWSTETNYPFGETIFFTSLPFCLGYVLWFTFGAHRFLRRALLIDALAALIPLGLFSAQAHPWTSSLSLLPQMVPLTGYHLIFGLYLLVRTTNWLVFAYLNIRETRQRILSLLFLATFVFYAALAPWSILAVPAEGDEPHYLLIAHSLVYDGDLDLRNNYANHDYGGKFWYNAPIDLENHTIEGPLRNGVSALRPAHDLGLAFLIALPYRLGGRLGVVWWLNLLGAGTGVAFYLLSRRFGLGAVPSRQAWAIVFFTSPLAIYAGQVFVEMTGAFLLLCILLALDHNLKFTLKGRAELPLRLRPQQWFSLCLVSLALFTLPWLNIRFWFFTLVLLPFLLLALLKAFRQSKRRWPCLLTVFLPAIGLTGSFMLLNEHLYGLPYPNAGYFLKVAPGSILSVSNIITASWALFLEARSGLFWHAPVYILALAGLPLLFHHRSLKRRLRPVLFAGVGYFSFTTLNLTWDGGMCAPSRYIVSIIPLLGLGLAAALRQRQSWPLRFFLGPFLLLSFLVSSVLETAPLLRYLDFFGRWLSQDQHTDPRTMFLPYVFIPARWPNSLNDTTDGNALKVASAVMFILLLSWGLHLAKTSKPALLNETEPLATRETSQGPAESA